MKEEIRVLISRTAKTQIMFRANSSMLLTRKNNLSLTSYFMKKIRICWKNKDISIGWKTLSSERHKTIRNYTITCLSRKKKKGRDKNYRKMRRTKEEKGQKWVPSKINEECNKTWTLSTNRRFKDRLIRDRRTKTVNHTRLCQFRKDELVKILYLEFLLEWF